MDGPARDPVLLTHLAEQGEVVERAVEPARRGLHEAPDLREALERQNSATVMWGRRLSPSCGLHGIQGKARSASKSAARTARAAADRVTVT